MTKRNSINDTIIHSLIANWSDQVAQGFITDDDMRDTLLTMDIRADELDDDYATLLGWDLGHMTEDQWAEWVAIVDQAVAVYLG